jgi:hypothetical protein
MNSSRSNSPRSAQLRVKLCPRVPALLILQRHPYRFKNYSSSPWHYSCVSLTFAGTPLHFYAFTARSPRRCATPCRASMSLYWLIHAMTRALLWQKSNSSSNHRFHSTNFMNGDLTSTVHGDSGYRRQPNTFSVIYGVLAQLDGLMSIKSKQGC